MSGEAQQEDYPQQLRGPKDFEMGVSKNNGTPKTPKMIILVGKPMVVGYHHFRKPPDEKWWRRNNQLIQDLQG